MFHISRLAVKKLPSSLQNPPIHGNRADYISAFCKMSYYRLMVVIWLSFFFFSLLSVNHDWNTWIGKPPAVTRPVASRWVPDAFQLFLPPENMLSPPLFVPSSHPIIPSTITSSSSPSTLIDRIDQIFSSFCSFNLDILVPSPLSPTRL